MIAVERLEHFDHALAVARVRVGELRALAERPELVADDRDRVLALVEDVMGAVVAFANDHLDLRDIDGGLRRLLDDE